MRKGPTQKSGDITRFFKSQISIDLLKKSGKTLKVMQDFTRRKIISSGILALGALTTQPLFAVLPEPSSLDWITTLERKLQTFSTRTSRVLTKSGEIELHCEMPDLTTFANSHGNFAGLGLRVIAEGNRLTFHKEAVRVTAVLTRSIDSRFLPA